MFADAKALPHLVGTKQVTTGFSQMLSMVNVLCFGCSTAEQHADSSFHSSRYRLVNVYIVKPCDWIVMFMFHFGKGVTFLGFLRFISSYLFACVTTDCATQRVS